MLLIDFDALTFDCYGTLIDWESGMVEALKGLTDRVKRPLTRDQILEAHARHESSQQKYTPAKPYRDLLPIVFKRLAEEWGVHVTHEDCVEYGRSVGNWPAFEDSPGALQYLKKYFKLIILSNVDNESFQASNRRLQVEFDAVEDESELHVHGLFAPQRPVIVEGRDALTPRYEIGSLPRRPPDKCGDGRLGWPVVPGRQRVGLRQRG